MKILLVGAGGYASRCYVPALLANNDTDTVWEGIVDPFFASCEKKAEIEAAHIPVYDTMDDFYSEHTADLAVISTPPFLHCEQSICALSHGSDVLCEKPIASTLADAERMLAAQKEYGRFIAIGYQWSFSDAILSLKHDILDGILGRPISFKTAISWPRNRAYYARGGGWGGKIEKDGVLILDSIVSNACAHYIHNMFFLLGDSMETSAEPRSIEADCLRANEIENFDTCSLRMKMPKDVSLYFIASHAANKRKNPQFIYTFENATVRFAEEDGSQIVATFRDGSTKCYGDPFADNAKKLWDCIHAVKTHTVPTCTVKTAIPHTKLVQTLYKECRVRDFPRDLIHVNEETDGIYVEGLFEKLYQAYNRELLLSELEKDCIR